MERFHIKLLLDQKLWQDECEIIKQLNIVYHIFSSSSGSSAGFIGSVKTTGRNCD